MLEGAAAAADECVDIPGIGVYDGDTSEPERRRVRAEARLVRQYNLNRLNPC
jgi:hypothetical protein